MSTSGKRTILVTTALPYANGALHLGHLVEHIQADIWVRFQKLCGHHCIFVCGDDAHGTPIMLSAQKQGVSPEQLIEAIHIERLADFNDFFIEFDNYHTTHSPENHELVTTIYERLYNRGDIKTETIEQAYDAEAAMFLPDRFVKGECPRCSAADQYGDNCEVCGATYSPLDLENPVSVISNTTPTRKKSEHFFFCLKNYEAQLKEWIEAGHLQSQVANKLMEWFKAGLQNWDISRDAPYFGFEIPNAPNKYFYVWLDAPVGYMASFKNLCAKRSDLNFDEFWQPNSNTELYHFVGKDIIYFHALFWPALLMSAGFRTPTSINAHGFLTINGLKMSKSRNTFITARDYLQQLNPEYLRYYYAAKLNGQVEDIDLNFVDFTQRINSDLVGKVVNIASRCANFINKYFSNRLSKELDKPDLYHEFVNSGEMIAAHYNACQFNRAVKEIMALADKVNQYIDFEKPWALAKQQNDNLKIQAVCSMGLNLFYLLIVYLQPILPKTAKSSADFLNIPELSWNNRSAPLLDHIINPFKPLLQRIEAEKIKSLIETTNYST